MKRNNRERPRVLILTQHYKPEPNFITADLGEELAIEGFQVQVITAQPNYPFGKIYDGFSRVLPTASEENDVKILRLPFFPDHSRSKIKRFLSYLSFTFISLVVAPFISIKPDIVIVYQTPFTVALSALFFKYVYSSKLVYISADLWPESFVGAGVSSSRNMLRILYWYSRWINTFADKIITSTNGMLLRYHQDGIDAHKMSAIPVWVDGIPTRKIDGSSFVKSRSSHLKTKEMLIVYAGNLGPAQNIEVILHAARICADEGQEVKFEIYGTGSEESDLKILAQKLNLNNLKFFGRVSPEEAFAKVTSADANIIHLRDTDYFRLTLPSKLASCLAASTPILCGIKGETANLIKESQAGLLFEPGNAKDLYRVIMNLKSMSNEKTDSMRKKATYYYETHFKKDLLKNMYLQEIKSLMLKKHEAVIH